MNLKYIIFFKMRGLALKFEHDVAMEISSYSCKFQLILAKERFLQLLFHKNTSPNFWVGKAYFFWLIFSFNFKNFFNVYISLKRYFYTLHVYSLYKPNPSNAKEKIVHKSNAGGQDNTYKKVAKNNYKKLPFQSISLKFFHYNVE